MSGIGEDAGACPGGAALLRRVRHGEACGAGSKIESSYGWAWVFLICHVRLRLTTHGSIGSLVARVEDAAQPGLAYHCWFPTVIVARVGADQILPA
jgi:hypothetical protein